MGIKMPELREECQDCGGTDLLYIEYYYTSPNRYDGISEIKCKECGVRRGRWSNKILKDGEEEIIWGGK